MTTTSFTSTSMDIPLQRKGKHGLAFEQLLVETFPKSLSLLCLNMLTRMQLIYWTQIKNQDFLWVMSRHLYDAPSWAGWHACVITNVLDQQNIAYMEDICAPATHLDLVFETHKNMSISSHGLWWKICHCYIWSGNCKGCRFKYKKIHCMIMYLYVLVNFKSWWLTFLLWDIFLMSHEAQRFFG